MRLIPASHLKGRATKIVASMPREGTKLRALYDLFQANKGQVVAINRTKHTGRRFDDLTDFYGLDIQQVRLGHWMLVGEWFGEDYVSYENLNAKVAA